MQAFNNAEIRRQQGCCFDCGRRYGDAFGFPDLMIPDEVWRQISPQGTDGGLLCPCCMVRRLELAGIKTASRFMSGPLCRDSEILNDAH